MILGSLETLCLAVIVVLIILLVALFALSLWRTSRTFVVTFLERNEEPSVSLNTVFGLSHYFPLPPGYAYMEDESRTPAIVRLEDELALPYTLAEEVLTFEEPTTDADGRAVISTRQVFRRDRKLPV